MPAAKGQGKTRSWLTKNQQDFHEKETFYQRPLRRRRTNILHRVKSRKTSNVNDLIYGFLGDLAAISNKRRHLKMKHFKVPGARIRRQGRPRKNTAKARPKKRMSSLSFAPSETPSKSMYESTEDNISMSTGMESATSRPSTVYSNASSMYFSEPPEPLDSKQGVKELLKRKSLIEIINNYIKVGIEADEQKAKRYMKKALSFGVNSGYLKPIDNSGHLLEVSSELPGIKLNVKRDMVEERKRRKNMRRGIVNFDDYNMKPVKKRTTSKAENEKRLKEISTNTSKKRTRSNTSITKSGLKVEVKKKEKTRPPKKKAKISKQTKKTTKSLRNTRSRRSPTPWSSKMSPTEEKNDELPADHGENDDHHHENTNENKEHNEGNNPIISNSSRKDDSKNHKQDCSNRGNMKLPTEIQQPIESAIPGGNE